MSLLRGTANQLQVIHALSLRETRTRFGAHQLGYLWALAEPIVWVLTFYGFFLAQHHGAPVGMDMFSFIVTGFTTYDMAMKIKERTAEAINGNRGLLFYPHVQPLDLVIARAWLEIATVVAVFVLLMAGHAIVTGDSTVDDPLTVLVGLGLAAGLGASLGLVLCAAGQILPAIDRIRGPLFRPLFWVSGVFFAAATIPFRLREILLYNPILQCVEMVRAGWFTSYEADYVRPGYVLAWVGALAFFGLTLERVVRRRIQVG